MQNPLRDPPQPNKNIPPTLKRQWGANCAEKSWLLALAKAKMESIRFYLG